MVIRVNFRKYEPPKFDLSNSAVYKLVHNIEAKNTGGIANRPEMVAAEEDFYYHKPVIYIPMNILLLFICFPLNNINGL